MDVSGQSLQFAQTEQIITAVHKWEMREVLVIFFNLCSYQAANFILASEAVDFVVTKKVESKDNLRLNVRKLKKVNSGLKSMSLRWCEQKPHFFETIAGQLLSKAIIKSVCISDKSQKLMNLF